jgi:hypothetical protein
MRKDTRFRRPDRQDIESRLPAGTLGDSQALGIWNMMLQCDDPSDVAHKYRSYRDSSYCSVPREQLRSMRDAMITAMREANHQDPNPRKEKKAGVHYNRGHLHSSPEIRKGA